MTKTPPQPKPKPTADEETPDPGAQHPDTLAPGFVPNLDGVDEFGDTHGPLNVYQALAWVQSEINAVHKTTKQGGPKWAFRGIDDVYNALHPLLGQAGLMISGQAETFHTEDHYWSKGGDRQKVEAKAVMMIRFRVFASDGSKLPKGLCPVVPAEGIDSGDKGVGKAWSYGYKTAISSLFSLPTDDPAQNNEMRQQPEPDAAWWDLWQSKSAHDDFRADNLSIMRKMKQTNPEGLEEVKQWMISTGLMSEDGRPVDKVAKEAMSAWSERLSLAVSNRAESSDAEQPEETPPVETTPEPSSDGQAPNLHDQVVAALTEHGPMTEAEIAEELKTPAPAMRAAIMGLSQIGTIVAEDDLWDLKPESSEQE